MVYMATDIVVRRDLIDTILVFGHQRNVNMTDRKQNKDKCDLVMSMY